jgi:hypothetical protein
MSKLQQIAPFAGCAWVICRIWPPFVVFRLLVQVMRNTLCQVMLLYLTL